MTVLTSKIFWIRSTERAIKTFAQTLLVVLGDSGTVNLLNASFTDALAVAASATFLSFLTSLASTLKGDSESPSLVEDKVEEQIVEKIEAGEPVGDPERVIEPEDIVYEDIELEADAVEAPKPKALRKRRATAKKRIT